ncbi:MAG: hypothetical protein RI894_1995 [Bacteroidota bacterium]|jgi:hypothetical protein
MLRKNVKRRKEVKKHRTFVGNLKPIKTPNE